MRAESSKLKGKRTETFEQPLLTHSYELFTYPQARIEASPQTLAQTEFFLGGIFQFLSRPWPRPR